MRIAYGHRVVSDDDEYTKFADSAAFAMNNCGPPGSTLVDLFPFREYTYCSTSYHAHLAFLTFQVQNLPSWFPGTHYARFAREWRWAIRKIHDLPFESVQKQVVRASIGCPYYSQLKFSVKANGTAEPSYSAYHLEKGEIHPDELEDIKGTAGVIYGAGTEAVSLPLGVIILHV